MLLSLETKVKKIIHVSKNSKLHEMACFKQYHAINFDS